MFTWSAPSRAPVSTLPQHRLDSRGLGTTATTRVLRHVLSKPPETQLKLGSVTTSPPPPPPPLPLLLLLLLLLVVVLVNSRAPPRAHRI